MQTVSIAANRRTLQIAGLALFALCLLAMVYYLRSVFNPVLIALLLAYILNPLVNKLQHLRIPRTVTIFGIYLLVTAAAVLIFVILLPLIGTEVDSLYKKMFIGDADTPSYLNTSIKTVKHYIDKWNKRYPYQKLEISTLPKEELTQRVLQLSSSTLETLLNTLLSIFAILSYLVLLPLYMFFLLRGFNDIWLTIEAYIPPSRKKHVLEILNRIHHAVSAFFRGKLIICIIKGLLTWLFLQLMGVKFAVIFAVIQAVASIIPFLVLGVGMLPNVLLVLVDIGLSWPYILGILILYGGIEGLESFVLTPWIMGKETGLHPLTVIVSLLIGGKLFGLFGLLIAIPLATILKILAQELILPHVREVLQGETSANTPSQ